MIPKEKAADLLKKIFIEIQDMSWTEHKICVACAKQCALIAVDEIMESRPTEPTDTDWDQSGGSAQYYWPQKKEDASNYWQQVKTEIEKL